MNLKDFLQNNSLKTKEINIDGIDEKITIKQLSMLEQYELMKNHKIEFKKDSKDGDDINEINIEAISNNSNFRTEVVLKGLVEPRLSKKEITQLNQAALTVISKIADEILTFSVEVPKQESKGD
ncbi:DNA repair protein [Campylobacter volucris]|uniref:DNA repair protein n=1 Tax=Campylobacter volucris TaxID=1031542 RepID=UPI00105A7CFA|nr:DNA repair protein [Campylobacter volucris]TDJ81476.1 DNA repair protein [Campylobacter volucris]TDJ85376.1 DNA repair protein [Campylobacter volucris]